jgi:alpha-tubulin suppressor-like RCC1 family protein
MTRRALRADDLSTKRYQLTPRYLPSPGSSIMTKPLAFDVLLRGIAQIDRTAPWWASLLTAIVLGGWVVPVPALVPLSGVAKIAAGVDHSCAVTVSGGVKCWGDNVYGQLGDGTQSRRLEAVDVAGLASGVTAIATGRGHTCALTTGGGVKCWGDNGSGQLGDGTFDNRLTPVDVQGLTSGVIAITAGGKHTCALISGGSAKCWGDNRGGQLGDGTTTERQTAVDVIGLGSGASVITAGAWHTCVIASAAVKCWGGNWSGQVGAGSASGISPTPVIVPGFASGASAVLAGEMHTCALTSSGGVKCWGNNASGQLGNGTLSSGVSAIALGATHTCALMTGGGVRCWGNNGSGQLGDGTTNNRLAPTGVNGLGIGVSAVAAGDTHTCALITSGGAVKCWGSNDRGQLGNGADPTQPIPADVTGLGSGVSTVVAGYWHTCALTTGGGVKCWGDNYHGQLGDGTSLNDRLTPVDVQGLTSGVISIAVGLEHTCALSGGGAVKCWGFNWLGALGDGSTNSRPTAAEVTGLATEVTAIVTGHARTCALTIGGGVKCWGAESWDYDSLPIYSLTPVDAAGLTSGVIAIAAGLYHTCALTTTGGVKCWGDNGFGQLGDGTTTERLTAVDVTGLSSGVIAIAAGGYATCALTSGDAVMCWGPIWSADGNSATITATPAQVTGLGSGVNSVVTGDTHSCARLSAGAMKCWGSNGDGQLGDGTHVDRTAPVDVIGLASGVSAMAVGGSHTCAVTSGGGARCWGFNGNGQLGDGTVGVAFVAVPGNVVTAVSDPLPVVFSFAPAARSVGEGAGAVSFTLERSSAAAAQTVYVSTTITEGFANNGDYTALSKVPYSFAVGETSKTVTVNLINDATVEPDETFGLIAQQNSADSPTSYLAKASFTITNDDTAAAGCATEIVVDNLAPGARGISGIGGVDFSGTWSASAVGGAYGVNGSLYSSGSSAVYIWRTPMFSSTQTCTYDVYAWWTASSTRSTRVPITVSGHSGAAVTSLFNQQINGSRWNLHGRYSFGAGARGSVQTSGANGRASADAVRFVLAGTPLAFSFAPAARSVGEGAGAVSFTLERSSAAAAQTVYVSTTVTEGFANNGDYTALSKVPYAFAVGETSKTVTVNLVNDAAVEPDETFGLIAQQNSADPLTTYLAKASFTITNDDDIAAGGCAAEIIVDNLAPGARGVSGSGEVDFIGTWSTSAAGGAYGVNGSLSSVGSGARYIWRTPVFSSTQSCTYDVYAWWTASSTRSTIVPITVSGHSGSPVTSLFNQRLDGGKWNLHGRYSFAAGARGSVQTSGANGLANADAVRFVLAGTAVAVRGTGNADDIARLAATAEPAVVH